MSDEDFNTYVLYINTSVLKLYGFKIIYCTIFDPVCGFYFADINLIHPYNILIL